MWKKVVTVAALALAAAAPTERRVASISVETIAWGDPLYSWRLDRDGSGRFAELEPTRMQPFGDYEYVTRSFRASPAEYRRVEALLRPSRGYAGRKLPCIFTATDQDSGTVTWRTDGSTVTLDFYYGCASREVAPLYASFRRAHDIVAALARKGRVVAVRPVHKPSD
ncbi:MAG TPA: hypothetical protein VH331_07995 [Allosphingosinicella sp.]|jgi:hypothetical protein|nr:hypothetical protein [Allosphingosinicella sp.]